MPDDFVQYQRKTSGEMRAYILGESLAGITVDPQDAAQYGCPKEGDMIARDPADRDRMWLVSKEYFEANFDPEPVQHDYTAATTTAEDDIAYARTGTNTRESLLRGPRGSEF